MGCHPSARWRRLRPASKGGDDPPHCFPTSAAFALMQQTISACVAEAESRLGLQASVPQPAAASCRLLKGTAHSLLPQLHKAAKPSRHHLKQSTGFHWLRIIGRLPQDEFCTSKTRQSSLAASNL